MNIEHIALIAQKISFAFEDQFFNENIRSMFNTLFNRYLVPLDPSGRMEPYDAIILLGRQSPEEFKLMVQEMKEKELISD
jgi:hypothetical protein